MDAYPFKSDILNSFIIHITRYKFLLCVNAYTVLSWHTYLPTYLRLYSPVLDLGRFISFFILYTFGGTPWPGDQPVATPLPTRRTTRTFNIHALSRIGTHDPSVRANEDISCLRPRCNWNRGVGTWGSVSDLYSVGARAPKVVTEVLLLLREVRPSGQMPG
jgi:hypothetical protein